MHTSSLPPTDRQEVEQPHRIVTPVEINEDWIAALGGFQEKHRLTNAELARQLGYSSAVISQVLNRKYTGNLAEVERRAADLLSNAERRRESGAKVVESEVTKKIYAALEMVRRTNDVGLLFGDAGEGKTSGISLYAMRNPLAILIDAKEWACGPHDIERIIWSQISHNGYQKRTSKRGDFIVSSLAGSCRLIIVDNAHRLTRKALQWLFDFHDDTGCGLMLVGNAELLLKIEDNDQRYSRVGLLTEIKVKDRSPLVRHLVTAIAPDSGEEITLLAMRVAEESGHFRALEKQLQLAVELKNASGKLTWHQAFSAAHGKLVRKYRLDA